MAIGLTVEALRERLLARRKFGQARIAQSRIRDHPHPVECVPPRSPGLTARRGGRDGLHRKEQREPSDERKRRERFLGEQDRKDGERNRAIDEQVDQGQQHLLDERIGDDEERLALLGPAALALRPIGLAEIIAEQARGELLLLIEHKDEDAAADRIACSEPDEQEGDEHRAHHHCRAFESPGAIRRLPPCFDIDAQEEEADQ